MKPLITFLALLMLFILCFTYSGDYQLYMHELNSLKEAASECAADAALCLDYEEYAEGRIAFDKEKGREAAEDCFDYYLSHISRVERVSEELTIEFKDQGDETDKAPSVRVTLLLNTEDIFHNRRITVNQICRSSTYELEIE